MLCLLFIGLSLALVFMPTGFEDRVQASGGERAKGVVLSVDNSGLQKLGIITKGNQDLKLRITEGRFAGKVMEASNQLQGRMDLDKIFTVGDSALVVITVDGGGKVVFVNPQDHYRLGWELLLLGLFALFLVVFGGFTGLRALLSFVFAGLMIWKVLVPGMLEEIDPLWLTFGVVGALTASIIFLVAGPTRKGFTAFGGAMLGVLASCLLAVYFTGALHLHGAVMPFAETLLYSGFPHLDLVRIYIAAVFLAASGAVMDLAMDVAASMDEVVSKKPGITRLEALRSGLSVGRAVVGTMTTTLLLAYSGGYVTLLMAFMAQGVPLANMFNLIYVAAEVLKTLVGSFGLVTVAPFTAVLGAVVLVRHPKPARTSSDGSATAQ